MIQAKVSQAAFAVGCLSDVYECLGDLWIAPSLLDKQTAGYKSSHDWLVRLAMNLVWEI